MARVPRVAGKSLIHPPLRCRWQYLTSMCTMGTVGASLQALQGAVGRPVSLLAALWLAALLPVQQAVLSMLRPPASSVPHPLLHSSPTAPVRWFSTTNHVNHV